MSLGGGGKHGEKPAWRHFNHLVVKHIYSKVLFQIFHIFGFFCSGCEDKIKVKGFQKACMNTIFV